MGPKYFMQLQPFLLATGTAAILTLACQPLRAAPAAAPATVPVWLSTLDLSNITTDWYSVEADKNQRNKPLAIAGTNYAHGVATHANSYGVVNLDAECLRFTASVGLDDSAQKNGEAEFTIDVDGRRVFDSGPMHGGDKSKAGRR